MKKGTYLALLAGIMLLAGQGLPVLAAGPISENGQETEGIITLTETYEANEEEAENPELFEKEIIRDGKTYLLKDISYEITAKEPEVYEPKSVTLLGFESYDPAKEVVVDSRTYALTEIRTKETKQVTGRTLPISETVMQPEDEIETMMTVTAEDPITGEEIITSIPLSSQTEDHSEWKQDLSFTVIFHGYEHPYYQVGDRIFEKNEEKPDLQGQEDYLLTMCGLALNTNRITDISWSGSPYRSGEEMCRNAIAAGSRLVKIYRCVYADEISLPSLTEVTYQAVYTEIQEGNPVTVTAIGVYEKKTGWFEQYGPVFLSATAILLLAGVVTVLFLAAKKGKEKAADEEKV